jgi:hypothetical protein
MNEYYRGAENIDDREFQLSKGILKEYYNLKE